VPPTVPPTTPTPTTPEPPKPPTIEQQKAAHDALAAAMTAENARREKEYDAKLEEAKKKIAQLNGRFAQWYYIISDAEFQKMRMARKDIVGPNKALLNKRDGEAFLAANKSKEGVITTASGLQYKVLKEGTGKTPKATDMVSVAYQGKLMDGTVFDESKPGMPAEFGVDGVIAGWTEALQLMKEGGKLQLFIPGELGYKEKGHGDKIGPNQLLIFEVELIAVK
jgi:FKBP-type peptidyl-prolyl cis-trans isomerase